MQANAVIGRYYRRQLTIDAVARALATSPRQLQRAYAEIGRTSFAACLRAVRLRNAAELLANQRSRSPTWPGWSATDSLRTSSRRFAVATG